MKKAATFITAAILLAGCTTTDPYTGQQKISKTSGGVAIGALAGALGGLAVGGSPRVQRNAVLIGAGIGALTGGAIGNYMDRQESELRTQLQGSGVSVTRNGDDIILNMPSQISFDSDRFDVKPEFYSTLDAVTLVLKKYNQTLVDVHGHTDSSGSEAHNLRLSQKRATSVAVYLTSKPGIEGRRFEVIGQGEGQPIASNTSVDGRALNRRVEIRLVPIRQS